MSNLGRISLPPRVKVRRVLELFAISTPTFASGQNLALSYMNGCKVKHNSTWTNCGCRPTVKQTKIPQNFTLEIKNFDFFEHADDLSFDLKDIKARCRAHFLNINIEKYQGVYEKVKSEHSYHNLR